MAMVLNRQGQGTPSPSLVTPGRVRRRGRRGLIVSYAMIVPAFVLLAVFLAWPAVQGVGRSFYDYNGGNINEFVGLDNFVSILTDDTFFRSLKQASLLTVVGMAQGTLVPLAVAWMVHHFRRERMKYVFRVLVMLPVLVPTIVTFLLWKQFLAEDGAVNRVLRSLGLDTLAQSWLGDPAWVLVGLMLVAIPWLSGINCLLYLAGFGNVPTELYEASRLDGAGWWTVFRRIEYPFVHPLTIVILTLSLIAGLQSYESVYVLTRGGPADASIVPGLILFRNAFSYSRYGYASAVGVVVVVIILAVIGVVGLVRRIGARDD